MNKVPSSPAVSIVIPCYYTASEQYLAEALESVLRQTIQDFEIVLVVNGSVDQQPGIIQSYVDRYPGRIRVFSQVESGQPAAENRGIAMAQGEFVLFLDADDMLVEDSLETLKAELEKHPEADVAYGNLQYVDENGRPVSMRDQAPAGGDWVYNMLDEAPVTTAVLVRTRVARRFQYDVSLPCCVEFAYFNEMAIAGIRFSFVPRVVAEFRQHPSESRVSFQNRLKYPFVLANLYIYFEKKMVENNQYTLERKTIIHKAYVYLATVLFRQDKSLRSFALDLFGRADQSLVRSSSGYRRISDMGLALITNLSFACITWDLLNRFRRWARFARKTSL